MNMFASLDRVLRRSLVALPLALLASLPAHAATWELDAKESKVIFKYSFEGKPYQGRFKNVKATFDIDPLNPGACKFKVTIPIADLAVDSKEVRDYLHDVELFDVDQFPTASFEAAKCSLKSPNSFVADGSLHDSRSNAPNQLPVQTRSRCGQSALSSNEPSHDPAFEVRRRSEATGPTLQPFRTTSWWRSMSTPRPRNEPHDLFVSVTSSGEPRFSLDRFLLRRRGPSSARPRLLNSHR